MNFYTTLVCVKATETGSYSRLYSEDWLQVEPLSARKSHTVFRAYKNVFRVTINAVRAQQFILLFLTACFGL